MNAATLPIPTQAVFSLALAIERMMGWLWVLIRMGVLAVLYPIALADAAHVRLVTTPTGSALAHARAAWMHRWCRVVRCVLGIRLEQRGYTPVSGIVVADRGSVLEAILLAAVRPCVFVAGAEARRWPIVGWLARLGGVLFVDPARRADTARINFMIQRAVQRRLLVVIFPECRGAFGSALFQPAAELGCTLTAAAVVHRGARSVVAFSPPTFHRGDRKELARQLRVEVASLGEKK
jgi:hypothetical protein